MIERVGSGIRSSGPLGAVASWTIGKGVWIADGNGWQRRAVLGSNMMDTSCSVHNIPKFTLTFSCTYLIILIAGRSTYQHQFDW